MNEVQLEHNSDNGEEFRKTREKTINSHNFISVCLTSRIGNKDANNQKEGRDKGWQYQHPSLFCLAAIVTKLFFRFS
ncbi:MAG: hypothetical protein D3917_07615 [Candidatus Electrothrix sp. AX5]|uniref:Uncharacterized protein n=1 Tax=Candidatus Electrothrix aarhusensis TaxID=1859131 RepID=A0A3S3U9M6_9BACT|nr:hypothetical protein [Candidatus Electrothrix sp. AX5]RWX45288.1 hypothetical protein H206_02188 [Candidatus Electrothrix aarhusensis]